MQRVVPVTAREAAGRAKYFSLLFVCAANILLIALR
jgi:hypothetical protein